MSWLSFANNVFYLIIFCLTTVSYFLLLLLNSIFNFLLLVLAPVIHLVTYTTHGFLLPVHFIGKFETLYIYLGIAALIGLLTGSILHFFSNMLIKFLNLQSVREETGRTAASVRAAREKKMLESAWRTPVSTRNFHGRVKPEDSSKEYAEYMGKDRSKRKEGQGLLSQTILEEDDDSDGGF